MKAGLQATSLDELVTLRPEKVLSGKDPSLPYIGLEQIAQGEPRLLGSLPSNASVSVNCQFAKDDILFGKLRPNLRKSLRMPFEGYCSTDILVLRAREGIRPEFAGHVFQWERVFSYAFATAAGTKMPRTSWSELKRFSVYKPCSVQEQFCIAAVLDTVDDAIAKTGALAAKLQQMRAGLLHDLLTRGLDERGQLRDPVAHPEHFQDTPLGRFPRNWSVPTLAKLCCHIGSGVTPRGGHDVYTSNGVLFIRSQNVAFDGLILDDVAFISADIHLGMLRSKVFAHDVLFNITGASIGRCCPLPDGLGTANVNQHVCALRVPDATAADSKYLASLLASPIGQRQMDKVLTVGNRQGLNYQQLGSFTIPWPDRDERGRIAAQIGAIESELAANQRECEKLRLLKVGLMADLLTGRVRVPPDIGDNQDHHAKDPSWHGLSKRAVA